MRFSNRLYEVRAQRGKSLLGVALQVGMKVSHLSLVEDGISDPAPEEKRKLAAVLEVKVKDLFPESSESGKQNSGK